MDYDEISHAFIKANLVGSPAELHGFLAGSASSGKLLSADSLIETVAKFLEVSSERVEDLGTMLIELYQFSVNQINNNDYEFSPILPDDDFILSERLASMGEWCQGFLYGLGSSELFSNLEIQKNISEALDDLASISNVHVSDDQYEGDETDNEANYIEIVEYIKIAVLTIFTELKAKNDESQQIIH
jgi:uncharacterized protein YgfB (UPF0149 family)